MWWSQRLGITVLFVSIGLSPSAVSWETSNHSPDCELILAQVVYRHGDRNPIEPYPTDPYRNETNWPEGFGQLTKIGKNQQFELGKYLRQRYNGFLGSVYSPYEIYVQSSTVDRAIMSAEANLAGLYPPEDSQSRWNPDLSWQPIPVHNMPAYIDNIIGLDESCARYDQIYNDFEANSEVMQKLYAENKELFQILSNNTGRNVSTIKDVDFALDTLHIEKLYNKTWPLWATEVFEKYGDRLRELVGFSFKVTTYTMEMKRLKGGPLLKEINEHMKAKSNQSMDNRRKFFMYSGHDVTVATLLNTLGLFNDLAPPYCSMVTIELHRNMTSNKYFVEVMYRNSTTTEPYKLQLPGCEFSCDLSKFLDLTSSFIPDDWNKECTAAGPPGYDAIGVVVTTMLLFILVGLCIAIGLILKAYLRNKRRTEPQPPKYPYLHLQMEEGDEEAS